MVWSKKLTIERIIKSNESSTHRFDIECISLQCWREFGDFLLKTLLQEKEVTHVHHKTQLREKHNGVNKPQTKSCQSLLLLSAITTYKILKFLGRKDHAHSFLQLQAHS